MSSIFFLILNIFSYLGMTLSFLEGYIKKVKVFQLQRLSLFIAKPGQQTYIVVAQHSCITPTVKLYSLCVIYTHILCCQAPTKKSLVNKVKNN